MLCPQIRGYLAGFRLAPVETEPFTQCICCSDPILERFAAEGSDFLHRVVANSKELEQVSGLADMKAAVREDEVIAFDDDFDE